MRYSFLFGVILLFGFSCQEQKEEKLSVVKKKQSKVEIQSYTKLKNFSSGSGMAFYNNHFYLVGDDDPFLVKANREGEILQKWQLWDSVSRIDGRIPKKVKPDFEAASLFYSNNDTLLLIFSSGSKSPQRDIVLTFHPQTKSVDTLAGQQFFSWLKNAANLSTTEINIEGAAYHHEVLYLFNRHNNEMYSIQHNEFETFIKTGKTDQLSLNKYRFELPAYKNDTARFSGASAIAAQGMILFSASIETTDNWKDDGAILGSYMGLIYLDSLHQNPPMCLSVVNEDGTLFQGKIEALHGFVKNENNLRAFFITDDDDGTTGWGEATLVW